MSNIAKKPQEVREVVLSDVRAGLAGCDREVQCPYPDCGELGNILLATPTVDCRWVMGARDDGTIIIGDTKDSYEGEGEEIPYCRSCGRDLKPFDKMEWG